MWQKVYSPSPRLRLWLQSWNAFCLVVTILAVAGSIYTLATATYCFFC